MRRSRFGAAYALWLTSSGEILSLRKPERRANPMRGRQAPFELPKSGVARFDLRSLPPIGRGTVARLCANGLRLCDSAEFYLRVALHAAAGRGSKPRYRRRAASRRSVTSRTAPTHSSWPSSWRFTRAKSLIHFNRPSGICSRISQS